MPLLDHFRWPRWIKGEAVPPLKLVEAPAGGRLERLVARQRIVRVPSELELRFRCRSALRGLGGFFVRHGRMEAGLVHEVHGSVLFT